MNIHSSPVIVSDLRRSSKRAKRPPAYFIATFIAAARKLHVVTCSRKKF